MNNESIFSRYILLAEVLGQMFENVLEIVVHDFKDLDHAIIYIVNGHISGRSLGGPVSEINLRRLVEEGQFPDKLVNFSSRNGRCQSLKSSSLAIRDDQGKLIGAFCLHFDLSHFEQFQKFLEFFVNAKVDSFVGVNDFGACQPHDQEIKAEIEAWLLKRGLHTAQLTYEDKQLIVSHLYQKSLFKRKGAISIVANVLQLTRQSIYNYIELAKNNQKKNSHSDSQEINNPENLSQGR